MRDEASGPTAALGEQGRRSEGVRGGPAGLEVWEWRRRVSSEPRPEGESGQGWGCSRDTGGSIGLRVQGSTKRAPRSGMHQDWEWEQFSTVGKSSLVSPEHCWTLAAWNVGVSVPQLWGRARAMPGMTLAWKEPCLPRALLRISQGNEMPGCSCKWEISPAAQPPEWLCRVGTQGPSAGGHGACSGDRQG